MYIVLILQYQKVKKKKNNCQILPKKAETGVVVIVYKGVLYHVCTYRAETGVVVIVYNGVLCHVSVYTIAENYCFTLHEENT